MNATISIDTQREGAAIDRMLFGQFLEHFHRQVYGGVFDPGHPLADARGLRTDVIAALRELRVPIVRWPGGCFASAYHWTDGVGDRTAVYDKAWNVEEPNTFGTDEFVALCRAIGAEPYVCTNAGTGTEEEASDWVEYCNQTKGQWAAKRRANGHETPHDVKYWSIGNENYGPYEIMTKKAPDWPAFVLESGKMMLRADPNIKLLAAALPDLDWTLPLLRQAGWMLAYISIHNYWDGLWFNNAPSDYLTCMTRTTKPAEMIRTAENLIQITGLAGKVAVAFDEWNLRGWHHPCNGNHIFGDVAARDANDINSTYTMADAVFSGCFLNACIRHAGTVKMACMAPMVNCRGPLFVHPGGVVRRTTFHVMKMYSDLLAGEAIDCWSSSDALTHADASVPVLDAVATSDSARRQITLALINKHPSDPLTVRLRLDGRSPSSSGPGLCLSGDSPDAFNDVATPDRVRPLPADAFRQGLATLPPHSITICTVDAG